MSNYVKFKCDFMNKTKGQKVGYVNYTINNCIAKKDCEMALNLLSDFSFEKLEISKEAYLKNLKIIENILIEENDCTSYIKGMKVLLNCYEQVGEKKTLSKLKNAFCICAYKIEGNKLGYKMWMKDALDANIFTKEEYKKATAVKVIKKLDEEYSF